MLKYDLKKCLVHICVCVNEYGKRNIMAQKKVVINTIIFYDIRALKQASVSLPRKA